MQTTISADQARINWRDTVDAAYRGDEIVIERYNKPVAVLMSYDEWAKLRLSAESRQIAARNDAAGSWVSSAIMHERMAKHGVVVG